MNQISILKRNTNISYEIKITRQTVQHIGYLIKRFKMSHF